MSDATAQNTTEAPPAKVVGRPFPKGVSGNPLGSQGLHSDIRKLARQHTEAAVLALVRLLEVNRYAAVAAQTLLAYGYGRPIQSIQVRQIHSIGDLSDDELRSLAGLVHEVIAPPLTIAGAVEAVAED